MDTTPDRALIYAIIQGGVSAFQVAKSVGIEADYLLDAEDRKIFSACETIFLPKGRMPSLLDIRHHLHIEIEATTDQFDVDLCAKDILRRTLMTRLHDGLGPIEDMLVGDPFAARDALGELVKSTNWSLGQVARTNAPSAIEEVMKRYMEAKSRVGGLLGFSSPWPSRDKASLGLQPGEVTVLLAKRKSGKTWLLLKWVEHIWTAKDKDGKPELGPGECILVVSMEMPVWQVLRRLFAIRHKLDYEKFRSGQLDPIEEKRFVDWCEEMKKPDPTRSEIIVVASDRVRTVDDIVGMVAQYRPKAVFIDSFYILDVKNSRMQMWERMIHSIKSIKLDIAAAFSVPVLTTTQLSGQVKRGDLNAEADAVAYAKAIGDYADAIDGIFGNDKFRDAKRRILRGMEAREYQTVDLEIEFDPGLHKYGELRVLDKVEEGDGKSLDSTGDDDSGSEGGGLSYDEDTIVID
jgi:replicative DNA helicase